MNLKNWQMFCTVHIVRFQQRHAHGHHIRCLLKRKLTRHLLIFIRQTGNTLEVVQQGLVLTCFVAWNLKNDDLSIKIADKQYIASSKISRCKSQILTVNPVWALSVMDKTFPRRFKRNLQFPTALASLHQNGSFEEMLSYVLNSLQVKTNWVVKKFYKLISDTSVYCKIQDVTFTKHFSK